MKNTITILSSFLILTVFTNCASSQFDKKPPFAVVEAKHQEWKDDQGLKGTLVTIAFADKVDENIQFDSIYFDNKAAPIITALIDDKTVLSGKFKAFNIADKNIIMDIDPKKEFGNKPPTIQKKSPFKLEKNECVISYTLNNKKRYFKLDSLQRGKE